MPAPTIAWLHVEVKLLDADFQTYPCPRCGTESPRHGRDVRHVIDIGLDHPIVLQIQVGIYKCPRCRKKPSFRTPLDFVGPRRTYVDRCRKKFAEAVDLDRMALSRSVKRLERNFHVPIARSTGWVWYREATPTTAEVAEYQYLVAETFSGVLSVDEVYDGQYAILCARDPLSGRTLAYELGEKMNQEAVIRFFRGLEALGIRPEAVVTDGSNLYPKAIKTVWAAARHQLCRFHWTQEIVAEVIKGVRDYRESLPKPKKRTKKGRPLAQEAAAQQQASEEQAARDEIRKGRFLLVACRENLDDDRAAQLKTLLAHHPALATVREFMDDFYGIFDGKPRPSTAKERWEILIRSPGTRPAPCSRAPSRSSPTRRSSTRWRSS